MSVFILSGLGLESIARFSKLAAHMMFPGFVGILILGARNYNINNVYPILGYGLDKAIKSGIIRSSVYGEVIILAIFAETFQGVKYIKREGVVSIALSALIVFASVLVIIFTFPYYITREITAPMYQMTRLIDYGPFFQRIEPITLFIWIITTLISTTAVFYSFVRVFCKMFEIQDQNPIILGGTVILYASAIMHRDITSAILGNVEFMRNFGSAVFFILPLLSLITAAIRKKGDKQNA